VDGYNLAHWLVRDDDLRPEQLRERLLAAMKPKVPRNASEVVIYWDVRNRGPNVLERESLSWCTLRFVSSADDAPSPDFRPVKHHHLTPSRTVVIQWKL